MTRLACPDDPVGGISQGIVIVKKQMYYFKMEMVSRALPMFSQTPT
jgi:hypothetical protein